VESVIEANLTTNELDALHASASLLQESIKAIQRSE